MLIGIDANEANIQNRVGSNEFAYQILCQLKQQDKKNQYLIYLKNQPLADLPLASATWQYRTLKPGFFWTQWRLPLSLYLDRPRPDVFLTLGHYAPRFSPIPTMVCVMDLAFLKFPQTFRRSDLWQLKAWTAYSVRQASHIFAISKATKKDLISAYSLQERNISVVYPGVDQLKVIGLSPVKGKYLLYVGTLQPRKNLDALIYAFSDLFHPGVESSSTPGCELVIAGKVGWKYQIKSAPGVKYLGYVPQDQLAALIKNSQALVLPSLYEGFGIPVIQAMSLGVPVLVSRNSSLPEIVGDSGYYIEAPFDANAIKNGIIKVLSAKPKSIPIRIKQFNWQTAAKKILEVINEPKNIV